MALRCVDASFVVSWLVPGQRSSAISEAWEAFADGRDDFIAPPLLYPEAISAVRRLAHRGLLTDEEGRQLVSDFLAISIPISSPPGLYQQSYDLATKYRQSRIYDACYLALSSFLGCQLLTLDEQLYQAVKQDFPLVRLI